MSTYAAKCIVLHSVSCVSSAGAFEQMNNPPIALTIAGSDSGGGAGIQADLKAFSALGVYGCSAITALTAQNTQGVQGIFDVPPSFIKQQLDSVFSDLDVLAVKVGMLSQPDIIHVVAQALKTYQPTYVVVDPVMVATSGDVLLHSAAIDTLKSELLPLADLITPNLHEAVVLTQQSLPENHEEMAAMIQPLQRLKARSILLKGGHMGGHKAIDLYHDGHTLHRIESNWINTRNTHGTGCTLSAAITAFLAQGFTMSEAIAEAKKYITGTIAHADQLHIGRGNGPVHHFYRNG